MKAIILSPGPSLSKYKPQACDLLVGVNRAAIKHKVDAWVAGDSPLYEQIEEQVKGSPIWVAGVGTIDTIRDHVRAKVCRPWRGETFAANTMQDFCPWSFNWVMFSFTTAIVYAGRWLSQQGRMRHWIDIYGCDWKGKDDFDGVQAGKNRSEERWKMEREITENVLIPWLDGRGITVSRHVPQ